MAAGGDCDLWMDVLFVVTDGDAELINYLQRVFGYCLSGSTREHALFFFYGTGGNGKGTLLNTVSDLLNNYAVTASTSVFTESKYDAHPTELASLMNARLVVAQETDEGKKHEIVESVKNGSVVTWQHINLHGEYDFSDTNLQDSVGLKLPQILDLKVI